MANNAEQTGVFEAFPVPAVSGYSLTEVRLMQAPENYYALSQRETEVLYGESKESYSGKSAFFPGVSLREYNSGNYRVSAQNNPLYLWSSTENKKIGKYVFAGI